MVVGLVAVVGGLLVLSAVAGVAVGDDVQHEHPDNVSDDEDLEAVGGWLGDRMGEIHADCTDGISIGEFDACENLDEEYESFLERYVTVERETVDDEDDQTAETFNETRENQRKLAALHAEFNATLEAYQEARAAGDDERARELARELRRLADEIEALGGLVEASFRELDGATAADLNASADATRASTDDVVRTTVTIEAETFDPTTLRATIDGTATTDEPANLTGRVTDENDTALSEGAVLVESPTQELSTELKPDGTYELAYQPVMEPIGATTLSVRYVPPDESAFLGSETNVSTTVEETASTIDLAESPQTAAFDESVTVAGSVRVGNGVADSIPVALYVGGERLGTTQTSSDGTFEATGRLPATVSVGDTDVEVRASESGVAVGVSRATSSVAVEETETALTVEATDSEDGVTVSGRLETADGAAISDEQITITVEGDERTARTDDSGAYELSVPGADEERAVVATYDNPETNLGSNEATTRIEAGLGVTDEAGESAIDRLISAFGANLIRNSALALAAVLVVLSGGYAYRRRNAAMEAETIPPAASADAAESDRPDTTETDTPAVTPDALLSTARDRLAESPDSAVEVGYAAARSMLSGGRAVDSRTHWEFYHDVESDLDTERQSALRSVTTAFETAAFAPMSLDANEAAAALDDVERCLESTD